MYDANGNILTQERRGAGTAIPMDSLTYSYVAGTNRLDHVDDVINTANYSDDIDDQASGNYTYDQIGNLTGDVAEEIQTIAWTIYGKIQKITRTSGSLKSDIEFSYSPDGHRAMKKVIPKTGATEYTYYSRDAQGNELATYLVRNDSIWLEEASISGISKLGIQKIHQFLNNQIVVDTHYVAVTRGQKRYELGNHLGNVLTVVNDKHKNTCTTTVKYFPEVMQAYDYSPFGAILANRIYGKETMSVNKSGSITKTSYDYNDGTVQGSVSNGGAVKNVGNRLYAYATTGTSPGMRRDLTGLTIDTTYTITFTIDDSIGTNSYSVYLMKQPGSVVLANPIVSRGTYSYSFTVPAGTTVVQFIINSSNSTTFPLPAHNFYVDNIIVTYTGITTVQEVIDNYRFGFNGKEKDNEIKGTGNQIDYGMRVHDPRLGKFLSVDPLTNSYPWYTPYQYAGNKPIWCVDIDGMEEGFATMHMQQNWEKQDEKFDKGKITYQELVAARTRSQTAVALGGVAGTAGALMVRSGTGIYWWALRNPYIAYGSVTFIAGVADPSPVGSFDAPGPADELGRYFGKLFKAPVQVSTLLEKIGAKTVKFIKGATGGKTAVIGQGMDRVKEVGTALKEAEVFQPSKEALKEWSYLLEEYKGKQIPDDVVKTTQLFQENVKWIKNVKKQGYDILDLGTDGSGKTSTFYNMEQKTVYGSN